MAAKKNANGSVAIETDSKRRGSRASSMWGLTTWAEDAPAFDESEMHFLESVQHKAPDTGKLHWHTYIQFKTPRRMGGAKKAIGDDTAHCVPLHKSDTGYLEDGHDTVQGPFKYGEIVEPGRKKGKLSHGAADFKADLDSGMSYSDLWQNHFGYMRLYKNCIADYKASKCKFASDYKKEDYPFYVDNWDTQLHLWGEADCGKTQFAMAQFTHPLYVRDADDLYYFDNHDGIVCDEMSFQHWPLNSVVSMLNKKDPVSVHIRYRVAHLPRGVRMIFCSNAEHIFYDSTKSHPPELLSSLASKVTSVHIFKPLWMMSGVEEFQSEDAIEIFKNKSGCDVFVPYTKPKVGGLLDGHGFPKELPSGSITVNGQVVWDPSKQCTSNCDLFKPS